MNTYKTSLPVQFHLAVVADDVEKAREEVYKYLRSLNFVGKGQFQLIAAPTMEFVEEKEVSEVEVEDDSNDGE